MITEYHVQLILNKMDELRADIKELIDLFKAWDKTTKQPTEMEVYMDEQKIPESVTINEQGISTTDGSSAPETRETAAEKTVAQDAEPTVIETDDIPVVPEHEKLPAGPKPLSKTQLFKNYRAAGGNLSWKKWQDAGMPEKPEDAQV